MPNPKPKFTGRFAYTPFGAGGKEPIYKCPDGYQISMDQKECVPIAKKQYSQQSEMLRSKVCGYLKKKIADEEQETQQYHRIELDIQKLGVYDTTYNLAKDILNEGQRKEIDGLKKYYHEICVRY